MKSERVSLERVVSGAISSYRQTEVGHFQQWPAALAACAVANGKGLARHYILNDEGQEYYGGTWID